MWRDRYSDFWVLLSKDFKQIEPSPDIFDEKNYYYLEMFKKTF